VAWSAIGVTLLLFVLQNDYVPTDIYVTKEKCACAGGGVMPTEVCKLYNIRQVSTRDSAKCFLPLQDGMLAFRNIAPHCLDHAPMIMKQFVASIGYWFAKVLVLIAPANR
jgi:hypothetical protein